MRNQRTLSTLALTLILLPVLSAAFMATPAFAAGPLGGPTVDAASWTDLGARLAAWWADWSGLASPSPERVSAASGRGMDPDGTPAPAPTSGSGMDPNGTPSPLPASGGGMDPNG